MRRIWGFPGDSGGKESTCNAGDLGSIPGLGRPPGEGNSNTFQYSGLENSVDRGASQATVHGRPAEIVDEEEDREKENKEVEQKEDFSGMNGEVKEDEGDQEKPEAPEQAEEIPDHREEQAGSAARVNGGTDEENGEELEQVNNELQEAVDEEIKSQGAGSGLEEADLDPQRPPKPEVKITSPQENDDSEQNKDNLS
ncbi:hypothetical protein FD755_022535 [Muntiacus reevesi]|uniref:Uncharacterized protein n=1 Tax=Muntiacus reevesi TaxID=9886 RepID=A0A5N3W096_MUNRE|nr:hypothetical protein FD755_022535 [Muntiacus reevesi]